MATESHRQQAVDGQGGNASLTHWKSGNWVRLLNGLIAVALVLFLVWGIVSEWVRAGSLSDDVWDDYLFTLLQARQVLELQSYAVEFAGDGRVMAYVYPPVTAIARVALGAAPADVGGLAWMFAMAVAGIFGVRAILLTLGWKNRPERYLAVLFAVVTVRYFIHWDLHFLNSNTIFSALVVGHLALLGGDMRARQKMAWVAGGLLAMSIALKLYSFLLLGYLILIGRWDVLRWSLVGLFALFLGVPILTLGFDQAIALSFSWLDAVAQLSSTAAQGHVFFYSVTLADSLLRMQQAGQLPMTSPEVMRVMLRLLQAAWLLLVLQLLWPRVRAYFELRRAGEDRQPEGASLIREGGVLLLAPLPFSTLLQPHHGVLLFPIALLLATEAFEGWTSRQARVVLAVAACAMVVTLKALRDQPALGVGIFLCFTGSVLLARVLGVSRARAQRAGA
jgi:hypothetical protein